MPEIISAHGGLAGCSLLPPPTPSPLTVYSFLCCLGLLFGFLSLLALYRFICFSLSLSKFSLLRKRQTDLRHRCILKSLTLSTWAAGALTLWLLEMGSCPPMPKSRDCICSWHALVRSWPCSCCASAVLALLVLPFITLSIIVSWLKSFSLIKDDSAARVPGMA